MTGVTDRPEVSRLEVVELGRRRRWTQEEKLRIVTESLSGPRMGSVTARRYGMARSLLSSWRRQFGVQAAEAAALARAVVVPQHSPSWSSRMEIVTSNGRRIIVDPGFEVAALSRVLDVLERR